MNTIDNAQDEICRETLNSFHGTIVQTTDVTSENSSRKWDNQILIDSLHLGTMHVKQNREMTEIVLCWAWRKEKPMPNSVLSR